MQSCVGPATLPDSELTQYEAEGYWLTDRRNLLECLRKHRGLADLYEVLLDQLLNDQ